MGRHVVAVSSVLEPSAQLRLKRFALRAPLCALVPSLVSIFSQFRSCQKQNSGARARLAITTTRIMGTAPTLTATKNTKRS